MEVKANVNFGQFRAGKVYQVDPTRGMLSLVGAGYLTEVGDGGDIDGTDGAVSGADVVVSAAPKRKRRVAGGQGEVEPGEGQGDRDSSNDSAGSQDDKQD